MSIRLVGREEERRILEQLFNSKNPEFLAIYGRRRVGKTFLIRSFFEPKNAIFFSITGAKNGALKEQINHFMQQVGEVFYNGAVLKAGKNWDETFKILTDAIILAPKDKKIILFFDEFPWMATKNSRLLQNLDYYWNQHWSRDSRIKLIICGSSASWVIDKIINNKGGLYNRITRKIHLEPFNLRSTKRFLNSLGVKLNNKQVVQLYMAIGGIPHYLARAEKGFSATQIIERLAFRKKGFLLEEFNNLFSSLFEDYETYIKIVRVIAKNKYGIGQQELFKKVTGATKGEGGISKLKSLEEAGFIHSFKPYFYRRKGIYYKVVDEYTLFYFSWIEPIKDTLLVEGLRKGYWEKIQTSAAWYNWSGYAFEAICFKHLAQISEALDMSPTAVPSTWRYIPKKRGKEQGAQIDLLFDRDDGVITICEIKYTDKPFKIDKQYAYKLLNKVKVFKEQTRTDKQVFISMISANNLQKTMYSEELITKIVTLNDLFK